MIMLDSNVIIELLNRQSSISDQLLATIKSQNDDNIAISSLVYEEVLFGVLKKLKLDKLPNIHPLGQFPVLPFSKKDAEVAAHVELEMEKQGMKKPRADAFIAASAISRNASLFTLNLKDFVGIPNLNLL